ncbi:hypothetical protein SAY87_004250 [Trapa incisa]|uniref:Uncharacterized protein n=2 Tax=Trapa TaxID=22665 RepID=A0AAN7R1C5_TRANT|nr:hypothetical protein SAY87_004250 [Trapa incisa]KAK4782268.1 hypothetical protein SAY86_016370 [Trapa natans]
MGRRRVELKRIENKINRQVTFAKRRNGLLKKAYELSVLCDAEVALIIFSARGKLYQFCSSASMSKTLERYQRCSYNAQLETRQSITETQSSYQEYLRLKGRVEDLQQTQRNLLGEDLGSLNMKELEQLERQLEGSLKHIRSTKTQFLLDQFADLQRREQSLVEANESLKRKLEQSQSQQTCAHFPFQLTWDVAGAQTSLPAYSQIPASQPEANFFHPLDCNSTLQIGYNPVGSSEEQMNASASSNQNVSGFFSGWMFN